MEKRPITRPGGAESMDIAKVAMEGLSAASDRRATYCDLRFEIIRDENVSYTDGSPDPIERSYSAGWAVRLIVDGAWGFAASDDPKLKIDRLVGRAVAVAKASAKTVAKPVALAPVSAETGEFVSICKTDPFAVPLAEKNQFLADLDAAMGAQTGINSRHCFAAFRKLEKWFFSSPGSALHQTLIHTGAGLNLGQAKSRHERAERSYPRPSGQYALKGYELLAELDMKAQIPRLAEEVTQLLAAEACPKKTTTLVLAGDILSLVIHESIGHPLELDRVFGTERNFSGVSFATPENLDTLKYASDIVTVTSDPTDMHGLGSFGWDDEGVKSRKSYLIKNGILVDYLSSRETAAQIGRTSTGAMRADGWENLPLVRMTNSVLEPRDRTLAQLIGEVDDGVYMVSPTSWSIDDQRKNFQFGCEIGWEIIGGKLGKVLKNPTFAGCTTQFWNNCEAIGDASQFEIRGTPNCGKGQPGQNARTGEGAAPARFVNIEVGG
jgi:TldD protein